MKAESFNSAALCICLLMTVSLGVASAAQDLGSLGKQAQNLDGMENLSGVAQKLHLSPQQMQQVMPILQKEIPQLQSIMGQSGLTNQQKVAKTKAVQKQSDSQLKSILSPKQFTSLQNFRSEQIQDVLKGSLPH
jgi:hypothetical protein